MIDFQESISSYFNRLIPYNQYSNHIPPIPNSLVIPQAEESDSDLRNRRHISPTATHHNMIKESKPRPNLFTEIGVVTNPSPYRNLLFAFENDPQVEPQYRYIAFICHGLEGNSFDMRHIRGALMDILPDCLVYILNNNFNLTNQSIKKQAKRLATEVDEILENYSFYGSKREEIIFIGHSMGGLVIRQALKYLKRLRNNLAALVTLNTPHLGAISNRFFVKAGMRILSMFSSKESLRQMSLADKDKLLHSLSEDPNLGWFNNILLFASVEDGYAPYLSAKVLHHPKDPKMSQLANNFWSEAKAFNVLRIGCYIPNINNQGINKLTGREAHVDILDNFFHLKIIFQHLKQMLLTKNH